MIRIGFVFLAGTLLAACSTRAVTSDITATPAGAQVSGVPFRTRAPHTLRVFQRQGDGSYKQVFVSREEMADMDRVYALNYDSDVFSNHTFKLTMREDGTLDNFAFTSAATGAAALSATSGAIKGVTDSVVAYEKQKQDMAAADAAAAESSLVSKEDALVAAQAAQQEAEKAMRELVGLPDGTPDDVVAEKQAAVEAAQLKANILFRRAGLAAPYADPFPR